MTVQRGKCGGPLPPIDSSQFDIVQKPRHYNVHPSGIECIEIKRHLSSDVGDAFKYVFRTEHKNGRQDLEKALYYLDDALRHADQIFLRSWGATQDRALGLVAASETNRNKIQFFKALRYGQLEYARDTVRLMLESP